MRFRGKTALITGASRGIGAATAISFAQEGALVGINYLRSEREAREVLKRIEKEGGEGILLKADVSSEREIRYAADTLSEVGGGIDILVANAGIYQRKKVDEITAEMWRRTLEVNLTGAFLSAMAVLPHMRSGAMVFVSSQLAFRGTPHGMDYAASKAGILGLVRSLALELAPEIRVNAVSPGYIDTDILSGDTPEKRRRREEEVPLKRIGRPEEVASAILYLASDDASYITGVCLDVNGGLYIH